MSKRARKAAYWEYMLSSSVRPSKSHEVDQFSIEGKGHAYAGTVSWYPASNSMR